MDLTEDILTRFGFDRCEIMLSTRPEKSDAPDCIWDAAATSIDGALKEKGWDYGIDESDGAFYGSTFDLKILDAIGRSWQCSTAQCNFNA